MELRHQADSEDFIGMDADESYMDVLMRSSESA